MGITGDRTRKLSTPRSNPAPAPLLSSLPAFALVRCLGSAWKKVLWYRHAIAAYPTVQYLAIADDDSYVQLAHLVADMRTVTTSSRYALYGLILWKAFYNQVSLEPATLHSGWGYADYAAASLRERLETCREYLANTSTTPPAGRRLSSTRSKRKPKRTGPSTPCAKFAPKVQSLLAAGELHPSPPYPFASGPLFAVSRALGELLVSDSFTHEWLAALEATPVLRFYFTKGRVPFVLRKDACYPASFDAVLGWWVNRVIIKNNLNLSLVNSACPERAL